MVCTLIAIVSVVLVIFDSTADYLDSFLLIKPELISTNYLEGNSLGAFNLFRCP